MGQLKIVEKRSAKEARIKKEKNKLAKFVLDAENIERFYNVGNIYTLRKDSKNMENIAKANNVIDRKKLTKKALNKKDILYINKKLKSVWF